MNTFQRNERPKAADGDLFNIDFKRIVYQTLRYWYLIILSVIVCVTIAHFVNRYATSIYEIKSSILIKEAEEVSGGELLYNNPLMKFYRNYLNELYIIKSIPLIERTVSELNFDKFLFKIGDLKKTEVYRQVPFKVEVIRNDSNQPFSFRFEVLSDSEYNLYYQDKQEEKSVLMQFGEVATIANNIQIKLAKDSKFADKIALNDEYQYDSREISEVTDAYISRLKAEWAEEGAGVISLSITGSNPEKEADFLTALVKNYQALDLEKKNIAASNAISFINEQLMGITDSLNQAERQLELFKNKNIVTDLNSEALRLYQKMEGLEVQKTELVIRDSYYDYLTDYIKKSPDLEQVILPTSVGIADQILAALVSEMISIQSDIKVMTRPGKLSNPLIGEKRRRMEELKNDILESIKNQKSIDKIKHDFLNKGIREIEKQLSYLPQAERQLVNIKRNYALLENLYTYLLQKRAEAGITKASNTTDIVVVNPPSGNDPISPKKLRNYVLGLSLGLVLPFALFVALEFFNTRIQSREDIEKVTSIPIIGGIGHKRYSENLEVLQKPKSAIAESFRALRSNLHYFIQSKDKGVFLITSSISGEGKTFTSINLASVFSLSGKRVLIVGADMRRPKIYPDFNLENTIGLSNYLAGLARFEQVVQKTPHENLYMVSGGPVPPNPAELIMNSRMATFLEECREMFDFIIIDSPPLALVTDAFVLAPLADHTLFIVRQNYTEKNLLRAIDEFYATGRIKSLSIVLNDIHKSGPGYGYGYGYNYGYGYGYGYGSRNKTGAYYED